MTDVEPKVHAKIKISAAQIKYVANQMNLTNQQVKDRIYKYLTYIRDETVREVTIWINNKVPKRTGQLREALLRYLEGSPLLETQLRIQLGSYIPYAEKVNEMYQAMVRHDGQIGYVYYANTEKVYGRVILHDPHAVGAYFDKLIEYTKERVLFHVVHGKNQFFGKYGERIKTSAIKQVVK